MKVIPSDLLRFQEEDSINDTAVVTVLAKAKGLILGQIRWHVPYRSYAFWPAAEASFTHRALGDIASQVIAMMDEWARAKGRKATHGTSSPYKPRQKRCMALGPGSAFDAASCGRWKGHSGAHRAMGSTETWEG